ncbi:hypothetical protein BGX21_006331, partial [Mortierella sp. AD011]
ASIPSRVSMAFNAAQESPSNPFWSPGQSSQPAPFRIRSAFIPSLSINSPEQFCPSPTPFVLSTALALSPRAQNVLSCLDSSSDDSDFSPETSPTKPTFTPKHSIATPTQPIATPTQPIPSPMQFLSSPSQAVLEGLIPLPDEENEDSDDVASIFCRLIQPPFASPIQPVCSHLHA